MHKRLLFASLPLLPLVFCSCFSNGGSKPKKTTTDATSPEDSGVTVPTTSLSTDSEDPSTTVTQSTSESSSTEAVFLTSGTALPFSNYSIPINDKDSGKGNRNTLMESINSQVGDTLVSSISADSCTILTDDSSNNKEHFHLTVGSGSSNGYIQFNFSKSYRQLEVHASAYYKTYSGGSSKDENAKMIINGEEKNFTTINADPNPEVETFSITYSESKNSLRFANDDEKQRFYLDYIKIIF